MEFELPTAGVGGGPKRSEALSGGARPERAGRATRALEGADVRGWTSLVPPWHGMEWLPEHSKDAFGFRHDLPQVPSNPEFVDLRST